MSEVQEKPKRWYKNWRLIIQWFFIVLVLCVIVFWVVVLAHGQQYGPRKGDGYAYTKDELQNAVLQYAVDHNQSLPILNDTYTNANCSNCSVINISALVVANGGILRRAPDGLHLSTNGNDNCGGNASLGCNNYSSYIWIVDADGKVFSYCAGVDCTTNNSGYQDVWP